MSKQLIPRLLLAVLFGVLQEHQTQSVLIQNVHRSVNELLLENIPSAENPHVLSIHHAVIIIASKNYRVVLIVRVQDVVISTRFCCVRKVCKSWEAFKSFLTISCETDTEHAIGHDRRCSQILELSTHRYLFVVDCDAVRCMRPSVRRVNAAAAHCQLVGISADLVPSSKETRDVEVRKNIYTRTGSDARDFNSGNVTHDEQQTKIKSESRIEKNKVSVTKKHFWFTFETFPVATFLVLSERNLKRFQLNGIKNRNEEHSTIINRYDQNLLHNLQTLKFDSENCHWL